MADETSVQTRERIVSFGRRLYERRLVAGRGGNISVRLSNGSVLVTAHGACLGFLSNDDFVEVDLDGKVLAGTARPSVESRMHLAIYRQLPVQAIVHAHPISATALTLSCAQLRPPTFETLFSLGEVKVIPQDTPTVLDTAPVVEALRSNNAALLRRHGSVTVGDNLEEAYLLTELLEEAAEIEIAASRLPPVAESPTPVQAVSNTPLVPGASYPIFSDGHIQAIVELVNADEEARRRGVATGLTTRLGIRLDETGAFHNIHLVDGRVDALDHDEKVDYLISGPEAAWRLVFGGRVDPFVAVTQRRLKLRGDMGKLSRWYAPFCRVFELWRLVNIDG